MLFMPIAVAAGMAPTDEDFKLDFSLLRENIDLAVKATTAWDSVHLYEAVDIASPSGLNKAPDLDLNDPQSKERLLKENVTLFEVFRLAAAYDDICAEWVNNYPVTFDLAYPYLARAAENQAFEHRSRSHFPKNPLRAPRHASLHVKWGKKKRRKCQLTQKPFWSSAD